MKTTKPSPFEALIDASVFCATCGVKGVGNCDCWKHKESRGPPDCEHNAALDIEAMERGCVACVYEQRDALLAACEAALPHHQGRTSAVGKALRAAIKKAKGETT